MTLVLAVVTLGCHGGYGALTAQRAGQGAAFAQDQCHVRAGYLLAIVMNGMEEG